MKKILIAATALALLASPLAAFAQDRHDDRHDNSRNNTMTMQHYDDHHGGNAMMMQRNDDHRGGNAMMMRAHHDWRRGDRFDRNDWNRYERVDYRRYHLRTPPRGYEWRRVDNNYVLAAATTGLIVSIIAASR